MRKPVTRRDIEAYVVAGLATCSVAVALVHSVAVILGSTVGGSGRALASELTWCTVLLGALFVAAAVLAGRRTAAVLSVVAAAGAAVYLALAAGSMAAGAALFLVSLGQAYTTRVFACRLAPSLDGTLRRRPIVAVAWTLLAMLTLVQSARLSTYMADPQFDWWLTTRHEVWAKHMCMPAYLEGADLQRQGVTNIYDARYYAALVRSARPTLTVDHLDIFAGDPFQYPPPFLLAPAAALHVTNDFLAMRTVWYGMQVLLMIAGAWLLAAWVGGAHARLATWLIPLLWVSIPAMQNLQYGQAHLAAIVLAVLGMVAFERERGALGGAFLAAAILSKIFPGVLLLLLMLQRRWRPVGWTLAFGAAFTLAALIAFGPQPFQAFLHYQLPRLASGQAFDFAREWPELRLPVVVMSNVSPTGLLAKLEELGLSGLSAQAGSIVRRSYDLVLLALVVLAARRHGSRRDAAVVWLALLNLGALEGFAAWADYVPVGTVWLLTLTTDDVTRSWTRRLVWVACMALAVMIPGNQPIPDFLPVTLALVLTSAITIAIIAVNTWVIVREEEPQREAEAVGVAGLSWQG